MRHCASLEREGRSSDSLRCHADALHVKVAVADQAATLEACQSSLRESPATRCPGNNWPARTPNNASAFWPSHSRCCSPICCARYLSDASPALPADESAVERYRNLTDSLADGEAGRRTSLGITRAGLAKRCVTWLKLLLSAPPNVASTAALREFVDALGLFPALFDSEPSARSRRARLTWLLTHDRRLDASTREAAAALIEACEHLGVLLWPDAETA